MVREDVLVRPNPTFAPYSVYLDVSPQDSPDSYGDKLGEPSEGSFVSDTFRVWELLDDCHNLATAKERLDMYRIDPEFGGQVIKIYANETEWWISDHPVFHGTVTEVPTTVGKFEPFDNDI